jgi:hypothetical protein
VKTAIIGTPIRQDARTIVMQEGDAIATYSREYYRLAADRVESGKSPALGLAGVFHKIAVPIERR